MSIRALIVEDDVILRSLTSEVVSLQNIDVIACADADEALALLEDTPDFSLVITDVCMPGSIDGIALAKMIWSRWPSIAVIITSGNRSVLVDIMPANAVFLQKPWTIDEIHKCLISLCNL